MDRLLVEADLLVNTRRGSLDTILDRILIDEKEESSGTERRHHAQKRKKFDKQRDERDTNDSISRVKSKGLDSNTSGSRRKKPTTHAASSRASSKNSVELNANAPTRRATKQSEPLERVTKSSKHGANVKAKAHADADEFSSASLGSHSHHEPEDEVDVDPAYYGDADGVHASMTDDDELYGSATDDNDDERCVVELCLQKMKYINVCFMFV